MAIGWAEIQQWDPANLNTTSQNLSTARSTLRTEAQDASGAKGRIQSTGAAVNAMSSSLGSLNSGLRVDDGHRGRCRRRVGCADQSAGVHLFCGDVHIS